MDFGFASSFASISPSGVGSTLSVSLMHYLFVFITFYFLFKNESLRILMASPVIIEFFLPSVSNSFTSDRFHAHTKRIQINYPSRLLIYESSKLLIFFIQINFSWRAVFWFFMFCLIAPYCFIFLSSWSLMVCFIFAGHSPNPSSIYYFTKEG